MEKSKNKTRITSKIIRILLEKILPIISYVLVAISIGLQYLAEQSMGVYRDLMFRNHKLASSILATKMVGVYKWVALLSIGFCLIATVKHFTKHKNIKKNSSYFPIRYILCSLTITIILFVILKYSFIEHLVVYPLIVLTMIIATIVQYIRFFYSVLCDRL